MNYKHILVEKMMPYTYFMHWRPKIKEHECCFLDQRYCYKEISSILKSISKSSNFSM